MAPPKDRDQLPIWHSVYFRNEYNCSYYNMRMIGTGVLTWGHFQSLEDVRLMNALPRTWKGVYNHGGRLLNKIPPKQGLIPPRTMFKTGPERGCYSSMRHNPGYAIHKLLRCGNNGQTHSYRKG